MAVSFIVWLGLSVFHNGYVLMNDCNSWFLYRAFLDVPPPVSLAGNEREADRVPGCRRSLNINAIWTPGTNPEIHPVHLRMQSDERPDLGDVGG